MKIKPFKSPNVIDVYAIYWAGKDALFLGMPKGHRGLIAYNSHKVDVIDPDLSGDLTYFNNTCTGIYHWALIKEKLLDDLLENDETAYKRFLEILKAEGRVDPDF
ncbi:hypothetical protein [Serratia marcescens]|uniref:hypothetical protein n=1 Tax=Serratia marcescens TaxID=615 RepID=UPI001867F199|nr:hypothetical protein [Serratia marcescens]